ncbi:MAG: solute:sodium symporter family transporter [Lentisphaeria bacterium]|nr:solute:sodium symporter family transporter [Lentisphaeria bacterium]
MGDHIWGHIWVFVSFVAFTGLVALATWFFTRREDTNSRTGFFLAGRGLTFPFIAGSLLLTNLSTEQMVGLNGQAFSYGLTVMVWEVIAVVALVAMALFFLPRYLKSGITTLPELMEIRYDSTARTICNLAFLIIYATVLLPVILYSGALGLLGILDMKSLTGIQNDSALLWMMIWLVGLIGAAYALFGGLRTVVVSDTFNGIGLLIGGFMITFFGIAFIGKSKHIGWIDGCVELYREIPERFNSIGGPSDPTPFWSIFTGVLVIHLFYWCTNQQIIQRTLAAKSLKEGQRGVLLCGALKLLGPLYLVVPGIMAYYLATKLKVEGFENLMEKPDNAYGMLVRSVLPKPLVGFFAAVMAGAILSSFNSALNSTCTLFTLDIYKKHLHKDASEREIVRVGRIFGWTIALIAMLVAPLLAGQDSIFGFLKLMDGLYAIPIFSVILMGFLNKKVPAAAANFAMLSGLAIIALAYFVLPPLGLDAKKACGNDFYFLGLVFLILVIVMQIWSMVAPRREGVWVQQDVGAVNLKPWSLAIPVGLALLILVVINYALFADFSVLWNK